MRGRAISLGYVVCDVLADQDCISYSAGGTSGNVSANLAVLGWRVSLHARIGVDPAGQFVRDDLTAAGVQMSGSFLDAALSTPVVVVEASGIGPRYRFRCPGCGAAYARHRPVLSVDQDELDDVDILFFDRASATAVALAQVAHSDGKLVYFEPNMLGRADLFARAVASAHIIKFSDQRASDFISLLDDAPAGQIQICTQGSAGFSVRNPAGSWRHYDVPRISVVNAVGAGDMFTAALLDLVVDSGRAMYCSIPKMAGLAKEAQWFAVANSGMGGARGLTRGRNRTEVLEVVDALRKGRSGAEECPPTAVVKNSRNCHDWLCPTVIDKINPPELVPVL